MDRYGIETSDWDSVTQHADAMGHQSSYPIYICISANIGERADVEVINWMSRVIYRMKKVINWISGVINWIRRSGLVPSKIEEIIRRWIDLTILELEK